MHPKVITLSVRIRQMGLTDLNYFCGNRYITWHVLPQLYPILPLAAGDNVINRRQRHS